MDNEFGIKELYDVVLKLTSSIEINGQSLVAGETIAAFDKIQLANFDEVRSSTKASGGYNNQSLIVWATTQELRLKFTQGIFSKEQFALMNNGKLFNYQNTSVTINRRETLESDNNGNITLHDIPIGTWFVYNRSTHQKITPVYVSEKVYTIGSAYTEVIVDYDYNYTDTYSVITIGNGDVLGCLSLQGKTRVKDDITGQVHTGIIKIPKFRLMSSLSMKLGSKGEPLISSINGIALPTGFGKDSSAMELILLSDDIDADIE